MYDYGLWLLHMQVNTAFNEPLVCLLCMVEDLKLTVPFYVNNFNTSLEVKVHFID
jgi:hypothetical protein